MPKISKIYFSKKYFTKVFYKNLLIKSTEFQYDIISLTKKTSNTDCAAFNFFAYIAQSVGTHYSGCQLFRSVYPMQPVGQAQRATIGYLVYKEWGCQGCCANNIDLSR